MIEFEKICFGAGTDGNLASKIPTVKAAHKRTDKLDIYCWHQSVNTTCSAVRYELGEGDARQADGVWVEIVVGGGNCNGAVVVWVLGLFSEESLSCWRTLLERTPLGDSCRCSSSD